jgi:hypothetical protein
MRDEDGVGRGFGAGARDQCLELRRRFQLTVLIEGQRKKIKAFDDLHGDVSYRNFAAVWQTACDLMQLSPAS